MTCNGIEITQATIKATREHFIDNCKACILDATNGKFRVNDLNKYIEWQTKYIESTNNGENDHTLTFLQRALWLQTGNMIAILP